MESYPIDSACGKNSYYRVHMSLKNKFDQVDGGTKQEIQKVHWLGVTNSLFSCDKLQRHQAYE
jgi:hypothetical protein